MAIFAKTTLARLTREDFDQINRAALAHAAAVLRRLLPDGKVLGAEFVAKNPRRADKASGSFKINLRTGRWADFATNDRGGDLISLVAFLDGSTQSDAALNLAKMLGLSVGGGRHGER